MAKETLREGYMRLAKKYRVNTHLNFAEEVLELIEASASSPSDAMQAVSAMFDRFVRAGSGYSAGQLRADVLEVFAASSPSDDMAELKKAVEAFLKEAKQSTAKIVEHQQVESADSFRQGRCFGLEEAYSAVLDILAHPEKRGPVA